jgi:hypothetical protein
MPPKVFLFAIGAVLVAVTALGQTVTISNTEQQSGFNGYTQGNDPSHNTALITTNPFNFTGQPQLSSISSISITLTIYDGDTGFGPNGLNDTPYPPDGINHGDDDDFINTLHLHLDGIETANVPSSGTATSPSLLLNGFNNRNESTGINENFITLTISGAPDNSAAILAALQDGTLLAQVFDAGFTDRNNSSQNSFVIPGYHYDDAAGAFDTSAPIFATLSITGLEAVPEPSSAALISLATVAAFGAAVLKRKQATKPRHLI